MPQNLANEKVTLVKEWLDAIKQQVITWVSVDPDLFHHLASLGHNELMQTCGISSDKETSFRFNMHIWNAISQLISCVFCHLIC